MRRTYSTAAAVLMALGLVGTPPALLAQVSPAQQAQQQQLQRMQEQTQRLSESLQRMTTIQERAHDMEQLMLRDIERLRMQNDLGQYEMDRLRTQEQIQTMAHAMSGAAGALTQAIVGLREMAQDRAQVFDRETEQQVERLRLHVEETCNQMEAGLRVMENLRERLSGS